MKNQFPRMPIPPDLAYKFLGVFARCEYALKCSGFAKGRNSSVEADWDKFASAIDWHFRRVKDKDFKEAVTFLLTEPPQKQVLRQERVDWKKSPPDVNLAKAHKAQQVLLMVRRVRNNLFHGAKVWSPEYGGRDRDIKLISAGLVVLRGSVRLNNDVALSFGHGVF